MARIRTIKPDFWKHEELSELPEVVHMFAAALLNYADDEGYFNANPKLIKAELFPLREPSMNIHGMLSELSRIGYISLYKGDSGKVYGHITNFTNHQRVNRPQPSKYKGCIDFTDDSLNVHGTITAGKEGKGKERKGISGDNSPVDFSQFGFSETQFREIQRIRTKNAKNKKQAELTDRILKALAKEFNSAKPLGYSFEDCLTTWEARGWLSFEASWLTPKEQKAPVTPLRKEFVPGGQR